MAVFPARFSEGALAAALPESYLLLGAMANQLWGLIAVTGHAKRLQLASSPLPRRQVDSPVAIVGILVLSS